MTQNEKTKFYKQLDKWVKDGLVKKREKVGGASTNKKAVIKEVIAALKSDDAPTPSTEEDCNKGGESYDDRVLKFLNTKINVTRRTRCVIDAATVRASLQSSPSNAIIDSGADTCLLGIAFKILRYSDRLANAQGFDESLVKKDLRIGTGVAAFNTAEGETMLVMINEGIDHTTQDNIIISTNQLRQNGCDVCDTHPYFIIHDKPGLYRIKKRGLELPFEMVNSLSSLIFRYPTAEELENEHIKVLELTSAAQWDPENLIGYNFLPHADLHYPTKLTNHILDQVVFDEDAFYDTSDLENEDVSVKDDGFFPLTSNATHNPDGNEIALTFGKTVSTQPSAGPKTAAVDGSHLVKPPDITNETTVFSNVNNNPVVRIKDSSFGHAQDFIYDNL